MAFPFLGLFLILILVIQIFRKKSTDQQKALEDAFWEREHEANHVRRQDISGLSYITIPLDKFPIGICQDEILKNYELELYSLKDAKILNLNNASNTDLKLKYGPANLPLLTEYDENFARLASILPEYAKALIEKGYEAEAIPVLEFGIECKSDVSTNYTLLADIYKRHNKLSSIDYLIECAGQLDSRMKQPILDKLQTIRGNSASVSDI